MRRWSTDGSGLTRLVRGVNRSAAPAILAILVAGCGQGLTRDSLVADFAASNPDVTQDQAECVVDRLLSDRDLTAIEAELTGEAVSPQFEEDQFRAMFVCGIEGDVGEQITEQLTANGVSPDDAPCVSDELVDKLTDADVDVLLSGEITDEFYAKFFDAMASCGAVG